MIALKLFGWLIVKKAKQALEILEKNDSLTITIISFHFNIFQN
jgi:hypothetical protein